MSYNLLKLLILILFFVFFNQNRLFAQKAGPLEATHLIEEYAALSVIRSTVTPILSGEMGRGMDYLYSFTLLVKRLGSYHFPTIWIEGQSYPLILGGFKGEQPIHKIGDELSFMIMVSPYSKPDKTDPLPNGHQEAIGIIKAVDGDKNFYIPIFSITPLAKVIEE